MREPVNSRRVDWVSTGPGYSWGQEAYVDGLLYEIEPRATYRPGSRHTQEWFRPVERPYLNDNYKLPTRSGSWLAFDIPAWGGADHVGMSMDYERTRQTLTLYQGDTRLAQSTTNTSMGGTRPAPGRLPYRLVLDAGRDASVSPYSATTHTEWEFTSEAPSGDEAAVLPLLQIDYGIATDAAGQRRRGTRADGDRRAPAGRGGRRHALGRRPWRCPTTTDAPGGRPPAGTTAAASCPRRSRPGSSRCGRMRTTRRATRSPRP